MNPLTPTEIAGMKTWMKAQHLTQEGVAHILEIAQPTVMRWLRGGGISAENHAKLIKLIGPSLKEVVQEPVGVEINRSGKKLTIYLTAQSLAAIERMGGNDNLSGAINRSIERLGELQRRVRPSHLFTEAELNAIQDACMSWWAEPAATIAQGITLEVEDALEDGLADQWLIDGPLLVSKLKKLSFAEELSIVMWLEAKRTNT